MPNRPAQGKVHITLYLSAELRDAAKAKAAALGESVSEAIRRALEEYVK